MKANHAVLIFLCMAAIALIIAIMASRSHAGYPMISGIANQQIEEGSQTDAIPFNVYDDTTSPDDLALRFTSDTPGLVPADGSHIILGGSGSDRTVRVVPVPGQTGTATITIIVRDSDGETNQDSFEVEVTKPLEIP
jgi:hypothetical protein